MGPVKEERLADRSRRTARSRLRLCSNSRSLLIRAATVRERCLFFYPYRDREGAVLTTRGFRGVASRGLNRLDLHLQVLLPVALLELVALAPVLLADDELVALQFADHRGRHPGPRNIRLPDLRAAFQVADEHDVFESIDFVSSAMSLRRTSNTSPSVTRYCDAPSAMTAYIGDSQ